jgi:hypothetical protein
MQNEKWFTPPTRTSPKPKNHIFGSREKKTLVEVM